MPYFGNIYMFCIVKFIACINRSNIVVFQLKIMKTLKMLCKFNICSRIFGKKAMKEFFQGNYKIAILLCKNLNHKFCCKVNFCKSNDIFCVQS